MAGGRGVAPRPLEDLQTWEDFEREGQRCAEPGALEYILGGEEDTIQRNRADFASFLFRPRVLTDVSAIDTRSELFGQSVSTPFYLSSVAKGRLVARQEGEACFVRAAAAAGSIFLVPTVSSLPLAQIWAARAPGQALPYQFYLLGDEAESLSMLQEALTLGASAVAVTVDANAPRAGAFRRSTGASTGVFPSPALSWRRLAEIRRLVPHDVPIYLKGIQTSEDALRAASIGVTGIIVSNHGGRSCAECVGALSALEEVSTALRGAGLLRPLGATAGTPGLELYFDSGVRSGCDALKALCLGARGVGLGRSYYYAAACHGQKGIEALLSVLLAELQQAMAQVGAGSLRELGPELLCRTVAAPRPLLVVAAGAARL